MPGDVFVLRFKTFPSVTFCLKHHNCVRCSTQHSALIVYTSMPCGICMSPERSYS